MVKRDDLVSYLDRTLELHSFHRDYSNNGLQIEGADEIKKIVFAVDASLELFEKAIDADFIIVHHGLSWGDNMKRIAGNMAGRVKVLMKNDISLYGAHLPLDAHSIYGHNAQLAHYLGLTEQEMFSKYSGVEIGVMGRLDSPKTVQEVGSVLAEKLDGDFAVIGNPNNTVEKIGIISGGGISGVNDAVNAGLQCFITGEFKHEYYHTVKELGIDVITLGHYYSEKPGLMALMELISERYDVECEFIDIPTGF